jgi:hypothetical protein
LEYSSSRARASRASRSLRPTLSSVAACRSSEVSAVCARVCLTSCWVSVEPPSCTEPAATLVASARSVPCTSTPLCSSKRESSMATSACFMTSLIRSEGTGVRLFR